MQIREALQQAKQILKAAAIDTASLDANLLLSHVTSLSKVMLIAHDEDELSKEQEDKFFSLINKRKSGYPIAYILGYKEFFGLRLKVTEDTLIPRPDTEVLVEEVIELAKKKDAKNILDIGTGSGAITVSLAKYLENVKVTSVDISDIALEIGKRNAISNEVDDRINFVKSDLFTNIDKETKFDIIVSNPPYIKREVIDTLDKQVKDYEPYNALEGGVDGLDFYRAITKQAKNYLKKGGILAYEVGHDQSKDVSKLMEMDGYTNIYTLKDLQQIDRVVIGTVL